jgi:haloacetate dehalogenase
MSDPETLITGREEVYMRWLFANKGHTPDAVSSEDVALYTRAYQQPGCHGGGFRLLPRHLR